MNLEAFLAGFVSSLSLWLGILVVVAIWSHAKKLIR